MFGFLKNRKSNENNRISKNNLNYVHAEAGNPIAQCNLALTYEAEGDFTEAFKWFTKAALQGDTQAQCNLGTCYWQGNGTEVDISQAEFWFLKAAAKRDANAQCNLGQLYKITRKDKVNALLWFEKSAENGNAEAQAFLGEMYDHGEGVQQNLEKAVYWYTQSAERGISRSQFNLAQMYIHGEGVPIDHKRAFEWLEKSAQQGNEGAIKQVNSIVAESKRQNIPFKENELPQKATAFANAAISIKHFFKQVGAPEELIGDPEEHSQGMCRSLYHELELTDGEWIDLDRNILALMIFDRCLKDEIFKEMNPELYKLYLDISGNLIFSITEDHLEISKNDISYNLGQKSMDEIAKLL